MKEMVIRLSTMHEGKQRQSGPWCRCAMWNAAVEGGCRKSVNKKTKSIKMGEREREKKTYDERSVQGEEVVSASELEPMKSETGQARAGDAVTATHNTRPGLMSATSHGWHKLCLPEHLQHTCTRTHEMKCNLCALRCTIHDI